MSDYSSVIQGMPRYVCFFSPSGVRYTKDAFMEAGLIDKMKVSSTNERERWVYVMKSVATRISELLGF